MGARDYLGQPRYRHRVFWPRCILAVGDAPPQDVGGPDGYAALQELLKHPEQKVSAEAKQWLKDSGWKPLEMEELQRKLHWQNHLWELRSI